MPQKENKIYKKAHAVQMRLIWVNEFRRSIYTLISLYMYRKVKLRIINTRAKIILLQQTRNVIREWIAKRIVDYIGIAQVKQIILRTIELQRLVASNSTSLDETSTDPFEEVPLRHTLYK